MTEKSAFPIYKILALLLAIGLWFLCRYAPVDDTRGDSSLFLLSSQALLSHGSLKLDPWYESPEQKAVLDQNSWQLQHKDEHVYNYYPPGTAFLASPFVAFARLAGYDMSKPEDDQDAQRGLSALIVSLIFLLVFAMAREYLPGPLALFFSLLLVAGTSLISVTATALWSQDFVLLLECLVLFLLLKLQQKNSSTGFEVGIGLCLALLFTCRPTTAFFIAMVLGFSIYQSPRSGLRIAAISLLGLLMFVGFSWWEFGSLLPQYYLEYSLANHPNYLHSIGGHLISPSRGLFLFSPLLILGFVGVFLAKVRREPLFWAILGWFLVYLVMVARFPVWWGGWCFGPRLMADLVPGLALVFFMVSKIWGQQFRKPMQVSGFALVLLLGVWGLWVHSVQGLWNEEVQEWNGSPNISKYPIEKGFMWQYPQFFATEEANEYWKQWYALDESLPAYAEGLPDKANVWVPPGDCNSEVLLDYENEKWGGKLSFACDPAAFGAAPFYLKKSRIREVWGDPARQGKFAGATPRRLIEVLRGEAETGNYLFLLASDDASSGLPPDLRAWFADRRGKLANLPYRASYLAVIRNDSIEREAMHAEQSVEFTYEIRGKRISAYSAGYNQGNFASLKQEGGEELSANERGLNLIVFDPDGRFLYSTFFDTHIFDYEGDPWFLAESK